MRVETINEPIETIVHFTPQSINVLRFKWNNRAYKVQKTTQRYFRTEGTIKILHFAVIADNRDNFDFFVWVGRVNFLFLENFSTAWSDTGLALRI